MGRIVVGVDGSEPSKAAVAWARAEAQLRGATLEVVCAYRLPAGWLGMGEAMGATLPVAVTESDVAAYAEATLDDVLAEPCPRTERRRGRRSRPSGAPFPATPPRSW